MLFRNRVRDTARGVLIRANTLAGSKVFCTRVQPIAKAEPPLLMIFSPVEEGTSMGAGIPRFRTVMTLVLQPLVNAGSDEECGTELDELCEQSVDALLTSQVFLTIRADGGKARAIEEFKFLRTKSSVLQEGDRFIGRAEIQIGIQYIDAYAPVGGVPLQEITVTGDAVNLFSPTGTFTDDAQAGFPDATTTPSPRKSGPDGRAEIAFTIPFQTEQD